MELPFKRHKTLDFLNYDHQFVLLLCWRIRMGLRKSIDPMRIRAYCMCVFDDHLRFHFEMEEKLIFPVLGQKHEIVKKALADHRRINRLLKDETDILKSVNLIEEVLEQHIRFEENILFPEYERKATLDDINKIDDARSTYGIYKEKEWVDKFW